MAAKRFSFAHYNSKNLIFQKSYLVRIGSALEQRSRRTAPMGRGEECMRKLIWWFGKEQTFEELVHVSITVVEVGLVVCDGVPEACSV